MGSNISLLDNWFFVPNVRIGQIDRKGTYFDNIPQELCKNIDEYRVNIHQDMFGNDTLTKHEDRGLTKFGFIVCIFIYASSPFILAYIFAYVIPIFTLLNQLSRIDDCLSNI